MTIQDFIPVWQAQPFRAFRLHTARGEFVVNYPMGAALTPQMRVAVAVDDVRVETFSLDEIERCEPFGQPLSLADAVSAISPETLATHAQLLSAAQTSSEPESPGPARILDPGKVELTGAHASNGLHIVHAIVRTRDGEPMLSTSGTRWNVHGVQQFENGTSLYLHHLDHPTVEQRVILWPPDKGTFDSFADAISTPALAKELRRREAALARKPAKPVEPPAAYFRKIVVKRELAERDGWQEMFGEEFPAVDPARYELLFLSRTAEGSRTVVENPCLRDTAKSEPLFELLDTDWDATCKQDDRIWHLSLRHASQPDKETTLHIDLERRGATIDDRQTLLPLGWIERHLRNFANYKLWDLMYPALLAGQVAPKHPDLVEPLAGGFSAELWAGEPRFPTPFLQPRIIDGEGRTVFDLRATTWSASLRADKDLPIITLVFTSGEQEARDATDRYPLEFDLITHGVTCASLEGSTTIGMIQAMVRRVSGVKWMLQEIPEWFAKGRSLPE